MFQDDRGIVAAEAECVQERGANFFLLRGTAEAAQVAVRIRIIVIGRGMDLSRLNRQGRRDGADRAGRSQGMADKRFGGADGDRIGALGRQVVDKRDVPVLQAAALVVGLIYMVSTLLADLFIAFLLRVRSIDLKARLRPRRRRVVARGRELRCPPRREIRQGEIPPEW